jgi:hypothetical protein
MLMGFISTIYDIQIIEASFQMMVFIEFMGKAYPGLTGEEIILLVS